MAAETKSGPWTAVIQGTGSYDSASEEDIEQRLEQFQKQLEISGHSVSSVRLSVGAEREYKNGGWHHAHSPKSGS
jgi:hypothetical protein